MQGILIGEPERGFVRLIKVAPMHPGDELFYASEIWWFDKVVQKLDKIIRALSEGSLSPIQSLRIYFVFDS